MHPRRQAVAARQAVVHVVLPGRQPRAAPRAAGVHRQVQGQVRRRLRGLPRVGAAADDREGHPARGHRADADQPDARGHARDPATTCARGTRCPTTRRRCSRRMAEVYAGFSEYTDHQVGRIIDYLEETGQLDNTIVFYCADNGASGEGSPNGSVNENKFFNGWPDDDRGEHDAASTSSAARTPTTTTRPAGRSAFSTPFQMFKRYTYQGGICDPLVISLAEGHRGAGRGPRPVPPLHRHRARRSSTCCGLELPERRRRRRADAARRASRCATASTTPTRRRRRRRQYYAMLGTRGIWQDGWKAVTEHGPISRHGPLRRGPLGALPHRRGPRRGARPRRRAPGEAQGADRRSGSRRPEVQRAAARRPHGRSRLHRRWSAAARSPPRDSTSTTRAPPRCPSAPRSTSAAARTRSSPRSTSTTRRRRA